MCLAGADSSASDMRVPHSMAPLCITFGLLARVKPVLIIRWTMLLLAASHASGCAAARIGLQADGTYVLERSEQGADCQALHKNIIGRIELIRGLPAKARAEQQTAPPTASSLFGRLFGGPNKGLDAVAQYDRERAHVYALQRIMIEKKCVAVDVDGELAPASAEMARLRQS
jgi:hypothetical protein